MAKVEVVRTTFMRKETATDTPYFVDSGNRRIAENLHFGEAWVVLPDASVPESAGYPLVEDYIKAMAARSPAHIPVTILNGIIVTREEGL